MEYVNEWNLFVEKYGSPEEIEFEAAQQADQSRVWTLWSRGNDFLSNECVEDNEVISHWVTPNPCGEEPDSVHVAMTLWVDCPTCEEGSDQDEDWDQDDCPECEGRGVFSIYLPDACEAKSDEEVWLLKES